MAKAIKRVGVIFLAVAIICLMAIGVLLGATSAKKDNANLLGSSNKIENVSETSEVEMPPISEEVLLDGATCEEQATKWSEAIEKSLANGGGKHILVTMTKDWIAVSDAEYIMSFGTGVGVHEGRVHVPPGATITLDLNGHTIDRRMSTPNNRGQVFNIYQSNLTIKDSQYDSARVLTAYNNNKDVDLASFGAGKITGANNNGSGTFIVIDNCNLTIESGMIINNTINSTGGAIYAEGSVINFYDGLIANNTAKQGGGIALVNNSTLNMYGGFINNNRAEIRGGGGINCANSSFNMSDGIISNNYTNDDGGGILSSGVVNITGGIIERNRALDGGDPCGGGICTYTGILNISNCKILNNRANLHGGGMHYDGATKVTLKNTIVSGNVAERGRGGGIIMYHTAVEVSVGAGVQVVGNFVGSTPHNFHLREGQTFKVIEKLMTEDLITHINVTTAVDYSNGGDNVYYTTGYLASGNSQEDVYKFFSSDKSRFLGLGDNEVIEGPSFSHTLSSLNWQWGNDTNQKTTSSSVSLPYTGQSYTISLAEGGNIYNENGNVATSFAVKEPGKYYFYTDNYSSYFNPTFSVFIEKPKITIAKPTIKNYKFLYNDGKQINFVPDGFDPNIMDIIGNWQSEIGTHTAKVRLKNNAKTAWADNTTNVISYQFEIIQYGIEGKESSNYTHIYLENGYRKNYEDKYEHLINDKEIATINGNTRYVLGNISAYTSVKAFTNNLRNESNKIKLYDNNNTLIYDGIASGGVVADSLSKTYVATGYKVEYYYNNNLYDTMYLSVLGDVVADGAINTMDVTFINRIVKGEIDFNNLTLEQQLAAMVDNKGKVTSTDGKILLNVIGGNTQTNSYFEINANITNDYMLWDLSIDSVTGKTYRVGSEITTANLVDNAIIGNIAPNTKASEFKTSLASQLGVDISVITMHKANGVVASDNDYVGTGCYINYNGNTANKIYLTVLGDLTGDGVVNTTDITYLNRVVNGNVKLATDNIKDKLTILSANIQNKGNLTTADSETLLNYIGGIADLKKYF